MIAKYFVDRLAAGGNAIAAVVADLPPEAAARRVEPTRWSVIEILCHLRDEEREDFRVRIDYTLHRPGESWPAIDPPGWVSARNYAVADRRRVVAEFLTERQDSLMWLRDLKSPDWSKTYEHPSLGVLSAGDLLTSWVAHDLLHLRQLESVVFDLVAKEAGPFGTGYAGEW